MENVDVSLIKKKSLAGIVALTSRTFILQIIAFSATFLLTVFLSPAVFGIFYVVSAIISFLSYFSDIGLAAALIQKKEELNPEDLTTTFTIQQILVFITVAVVLFFSSRIAAFYRLDVQGLWLFRVLTVCFFLSSLKTIPSIILERRLDFQKLIIPQILETLSFYLIAVFLAWRGLGITSFTWAVLVRAVVGLITMYLLAPWKISVGLSLTVARRLLRFGLPFQLNSLLALVKDDLLTVFLGKILPFAQVGYIGWAKKWADVPLRLILDSVVRVTFPAFSRLQHAKDVLGKGIGKTLFGSALLTFPITVGLIFFIEPFVAIIPRYNKWEPALPSFYMFAVAAAAASLSVPLTNALNAVGKIRITLYLMVMWTLATWILTVFFVSLIGFNGVALALFIITGTIVLVVQLAKRVAPFGFWGSVAYPLVGAALQSFWYFLVRGNPPYSVGRLIFVASSGVILYVAFVWYCEKDKIKGIIREYIHKNEVS